MQQQSYYQLNNQFPILPPMSSVNICPHCCAINNFRFPDFQDFRCQPYPGSTRIRVFFRNAYGCWQFENFRDEIYYRSVDSPRTWCYQRPGYNSVVLCINAASILDQTYGIFLPPCSNPSSWLYRGYVEHFSQENVCVVEFSSERFIMQNSVQGSNQIIDQRHVPPPPVYTDRASNVQLMQQTCIQGSEETIYQHQHRPPSPRYSVPDRTPDVNLIEFTEETSVQGSELNINHQENSSPTPDVQPKELIEQSSVQGSELNIDHQDNYSPTPGNSASDRTSGNPFMEVDKKPQPIQTHSHLGDNLANLQGALPKEETSSSKITLSSQVPKLPTINKNLVSNYGSEINSSDSREMPKEAKCNGSKETIPTSDQISSSPPKSPNENPPSISKRQKVQRTKVGSYQQTKNLLITNKYKKVFSELQRKFKLLHEYRSVKENSKSHCWAEFPIKFAVERMGEFPFRFKILFGDIEEMKEQNEQFPKLSITPQKNLLVFGLPAFGKTTLCYLMASHWSSGVPEMNRFDLCIYCSLPDMRYGRDFSMEIVHLCFLVLSKQDVDMITLQKVLLENSGKIILLLDGFDKLSESEQNEVMTFVKFKPTFCESTIVLTTVPTRHDSSLVKSFQKLINIEGCCSTLIFNLLREMDLDRESIRMLNQKIKLDKFDLLNELPPFFAVWIAKVVCTRYRNFGHFDSLFSLLEVVVNDILAENNDSRDWTESLLRLGKMCFDSLVVGTYFLNDRALQERFGKDLQFFEDCRFLYKSKKTAWAISSKVLQVFFATLFLRYVWSRCKDQAEFLKEVYCCNGCTGDYVIMPPDRVCYVGLIPEIILKMDFNMCLDESNFQMYYDVDRIEHSQAFDSVNLLIRIDNNLLPRFSFKPVKDTALNGHFAFLDDLLNSTSLDNFLFEQRFYENTEEQKFFFKCGLKEDDRMEHALFVVLREKKNLLVDRLYLDFSFSKLVELFEFIENILLHFLKSFTLNDSLMYQTFDEFVLNMIDVFLDCDLLSLAVVSCASNACDIDDLIFQVCCSDNEKQVTVSRDKLSKMPSMFRTSYNKHEFFLNRWILQGYLTEMKERSEDIRVTINIW